MAGQVAHGEQGLALQGAQVGKHLGVIRQDQLVAAVYDELAVRGIAAQGNELLVVAEHGVRPAQLLPGVDLPVVGIDHDPGVTGGKSGVGGVIPLEGSTGVVPTLVGDGLQQLLRLEDPAGGEIMVSVDGLQVPVVLDGPEGHVGHAQLLPLIDVGGALHQVEAGGDALGRQLPIPGGVISQPGDDTGLVVVAEVEAVPGHVFQLVLPPGQQLLEGNQVNLPGAPLAGDRVAAVQVHVLELEHHVELGALGVGVLLGLVDGHTGALAHGEQIILGEHLLAHLLQILVDVGAVAAAQIAGGVGCTAGGHVGQAFPLGDHGDDVHAEAVNALFAPPGHHIKDGGAYLRVVPVQVGLLGGEAVEVVHIGSGIIGPGGTGEGGAPVVGLLAVLALPPDVEVSLGVVFGLAALHKPGVLVRGVVDHQIHHDFKPPPVRFCQKAVKILHRSKFFHNRSVIRDIIAVVTIRRFVDGRQPDHIHSKRF